MFNFNDCFSFFKEVMNMLQTNCVVLLWGLIYDHLHIIMVIICLFIHRFFKVCIFAS